MLVGRSRPDYSEDSSMTGKNEETPKNPNKCTRKGHQSDSPYDSIQAESFYAAHGELGNIICQSHTDGTGW